MTLPPLKKWPRWAALAYALFGLILFGLSTIKPRLEDGEDNQRFKLILQNSYICAGYWSCPFDVNISFKTADIMLGITPLGTYVNATLTKAYLNDEPEDSVVHFFFTNRFSPILPYYWLFTILWGCVFYYVLTWALVKALALVRYKK